MKKKEIESLSNSIVRNAVLFGLSTGIMFLIREIVKEIEPLNLTRQEKASIIISYFELLKDYDKDKKKVTG